MTALLSTAILADHPLPRLPLDGDKEDRGAVLVVGGETVMAGAAILAGTAALRVGAGKLQICGRRDAVAAMAVAVPEARIVLTRSGGAMGPALRDAASASAALVIGPGMDTGPVQRRLARALLTDAPAAAVIDAGALPDAGEADTFAGLSRGRVVLTPHAGEMASMLGRDKAAIRADPLGAARDAAALFQAVVVMKGATSFVVSPDGAAWRHESGVSGLGTSGSGDVLAGAIGGLLARGAPPLVAALWGVVLHARAGDDLGQDMPLGFLARELPGRLALVLARLCGPSL